MVVETNLHILVLYEKIDEYLPTLLTLGMQNSQSFLEHIRLLNKFRSSLRQKTPGRRGHGARYVLVSFNSMHRLS